MKLQPTTQLRIKREHDYVGYDERQINIDTLQQLWAPVGEFHPDESEWRDVPIVEPSSFGVTLEES